jgi:hypothetical protein
MILPAAQPTLGGVRLAWFTDMDPPDRAGLGLTSAILPCDRLKYRYVAVATSGYFITYLAWAEMNNHPGRAFLETADAMPDRWFVSEQAVLGELDRRYGASA